MNEVTEIPGCGGSRSRTSLGFHDLNVDACDRGSDFDTRDLSLRPKSSYARRHQFKKKNETETDSASNGNDTLYQSDRPARPKSRLGRTSVPRSERKISLMETEVIVDIDIPHGEVTVDTVGPHRDAAMKNSVNNVYDRFASTRQAKRESKRSKQFCDSNTDVFSKQTAEIITVDSNSNSMDTRAEIHINDVQILPSNADLINNLRSTHASTFESTIVPRNSPIQIRHQQPLVQHSQRRLNNSPVRQESFNSKQQSVTDHVQQPMRSDTSTNNDSMHAEKAGNAQIHLQRNNSNVGRPKNPEPICSRPLERPDVRPSTRSRRLQKRYVQQSQHFNAVSVRPTSESVILARQRTEKNLIKKQTENRPHSEKILVTSNMISVSENPTQGPQTLVTSKGGVTPASHVQASGFRGYDPSSRLKPSAQSRYAPGDTTLPRQGLQNNMISSRKPLTLMKLPPLEASIVSKKNERGLTLAQRETCV